MDASFDYVRRIVPATETMIFVPGQWWLAGAAIDLYFSSSLYYDSSAGGEGQAVTSYLSCVRASAAYAKNLDGTLTSFAVNTLRIGTGTGLLVEGARMNTLKTSADFTTGSNWLTDSPGSSVIITADQAVAPDGTTTMDKLDDGTGTSRHILFQQDTTNYTANVNHTFSVFVKDIDRRYVALFFGSTGLVYLFADLQTGTITDSGTSGSGATFVSASIEAYANGVYRLILVGNSGNSETNAYFEICLSNSATKGGGTEPNYTGTNKSIYVWGAQAEDSVSFASSYIPTTTGTVTRAADLVVCIGNIDTLLSTVPFSFVTNGISPYRTTSSDRWMVSGANNNIAMGLRSNDVQFFLSRADTSNPGEPVLGSGLLSTGFKIGYADDGANLSAVGNAGTVLNAATIQSPYFDNDNLLSSGGGSAANGYLRRLTGWTSKLSDGTLQGFTTP